MFNTCGLVMYIKQIFNIHVPHLERGVVLRQYYIDESSDIQIISDYH